MRYLGHTVEKFHKYVSGRKVLVVTDYLPIMAIHKKVYGHYPATTQKFLLRLQKLIHK